MGKYSSLFQQQTAESTTAANVPDADTGASSSTGSTSAGSGGLGLSSSTDGPASSSSPPPATTPTGRRRLVHRRRDGVGAAAAAAGASPAPPAVQSGPQEQEQPGHHSSGVRERGGGDDGERDGSQGSSSSSSDTSAGRPNGLTASEAVAEATADFASSSLLDARDADADGGSAKRGVGGEAGGDGEAARVAVVPPGANDAPFATEQLVQDSSPTRIFTCDACAHHVCTSYEALEQHALECHGDALADYTRLRTVAEKLVPIWAEVLRRKASVVQQWGERIFAVAVQRDAGAEKMAEAHRARAQLELVVQHWHPRAKVFIFGSSVAFGVWDGISDIDFTVVDVEGLEAGVWPPSEKNAVRSITELLRRAGFSFINLEPISHARVPIIKHHASLPIRLTEGQRHRLRAEARAAAAAASPSTPPPSEPANATAVAREVEVVEVEEEEGEGHTQLEAELIIARTVRYHLNLPAGPGDSAILEASIRLAVGSAAVQQVWWNRTRDACCMTFDTTTNAVKASTCPLHFLSAGMRARVQPLHEECKPELHGMDFDLSFRAFGIRNSYLLRRYLLSHPCARPGALVLKDWSKTSGVNNSMNGYLTSYAINIMWIYYLVHRGVVPYVCPAQDIPASLRHTVVADSQYAAMVDPAWSPAERAAMETQAGELLLGFFHYYAFEFDWVNHVVSLNRRGVTTKASLGWDVEDVGHSPLSGGAAGSDGYHADTHGGGGYNSPGLAAAAASGSFDGALGSSAAMLGRRSRSVTRYSFCIEDPYEENLNLGRHMGVTKTLRVQTELYRGLISLLKDDVQHCCVFAASASAGGGGGHEPGSAGATSAVANPAELPVRVLYTLMAISTRELAAARRRHGADDSVFLGVTLLHLTERFAAQAPTEWRLASQVWNTHQLLHRLGLKLHGGQHVLPRREVGVRRLAARAPPGVVLANAPEPVPEEAAGDGTSPADGDLSAPPSTATPTHAPLSRAAVEEMNAALLRSVPPVRLHHDMLLAMVRGYSCLTPRWVAWTKPWAALSAWWTDRQSSSSSSSSAAAAAAAAAAAVPPPQHQQQQPPQGISAVAGQAPGPMHQTRPQLLPRRWVHGAPMAARETVGRRALQIVFRR
ncbi:RNA editing 3' terminal uridylyl transferase 1 [Novymonas esmeraldas]|uniref:RNA uridylyltransferase n=1 Tax=Novymonas esmeraldas TaxID=1808958 RepID=A0AAW0F7J9_9TRYP